MSKLHILQCYKCLRLIGIARGDGMVADLIFAGGQYERGYYNHIKFHNINFEDLIQWQSRSVWLS